MTVRPERLHSRADVGTSPQALFVFRLRLYREKRGVSLESVSSITKIRLDLLEALERNDLSRWPRGLYARGWVRLYAAVVGLDPDDTVEEFCRLFPNGDRRLGGTLRDIAAIVEQPSEYSDELREVERRRGVPRVSSLPTRPAMTRALLTLWMALVRSGPLSIWRRVPNHL